MNKLQNNFLYFWITNKKDQRTLLPKKKIQKYILLSTFKFQLLFCNKGDVYLA